MNVNGKLEALGAVTGYPVEQDEYEGREDRYITYTYEDERPALFGDNSGQAGTAWLRVCLFVPKSHDYFGDKDKIMAELARQGFNIESCQTWLEDARKGTEKIRRVTISVNITE
ncbi:MAG: hypothetical protein NC331_11325 [Lachnospiraceae bacterium]|nr:hypothetical protein [Lachnospiraceae bacterium]MCM1239958.1 hypothetical protein [Lachnospiraceae bacterium]